MRLYRLLVHWLVLGVNAVRPAPLVPLAPTTFEFNENPFAKRTYGKAIDSPAGMLAAAVGRVLRLIVRTVTPRRLAVLALLLLLLTVPDFGGGGLVALGFAGDTLTVEAQREKLTVGLKEVAKIQAKYQGEIMPTDVAEALDVQCEELKGYQDEIDGEYKRQGRLSDLQRWAGHIPEPTLPAPPEPVKTFNRIAGYMGLGEYVLSQKLMAEAVKNGTLAHTPVKVEMGTGLLNLKHYDGVPWVEVSHEEAKAFNEAWESKAVPTIGTGVVEPTRLPGITQVQRDLDLTVRDLLPTTTTDSDQVEYVRRNATTRAAAETAHGAAKPESAFTFDLVTSPVRTIAVHMPVQKQQLADFGQLRSEIDNFLLYDLAKREEEQFIYGDGTGVNLEGIAVVSGTTDIATNGRFNTGTDTLIDAIRMGMTDVRLVGYSANAVLIAHEDWETIQLEKATDNNYIWVVVTDDNGSRMWGIRVVPSFGATANRGSATEERNIIVGDWSRGAQIADRQQSSIEVGTINAQFTENIRTILAEERLAFPIRVPAAFALFVTQVDVP